MTPLRVYVRQKVRSSNTPKAPSAEGRKIEEAFQKAKPTSFMSTTDIDSGNALLIAALHEKLEDVPPDVRSKVPAITFEEHTYNSETNQWEFDEPGVLTAIDISGDHVLAIRYA